MLLLDQGPAVDRYELASAVRRYLALPYEPAPSSTSFERLIGELWGPALAYAAVLPAEYRRYAAGALVSEAENYLDAQVVVVRDCWALLAAAGADSSARGKELVAGARARQSVGEREWLASAEAGPEGALALIALYHHLAALEALASDQPLNAQQHLTHAERAAERCDVTLSVATSLLSAAVAVRTGMATDQVT